MKIESKKNSLLQKLALSLGSAAFAAAALAQAPAEVESALADYADNVVVATYSKMGAAAVKLDKAVESLKKDPSDAKVAEAAGRWKEVRKQWELSESFLFGPAAFASLDPKLDSWPLDRVQLDAVLAQIDSGKLEIDAGYVRDYLGAALRGFHAVEYLLYRDGKPVDFTYRPIAQYGAETQVETRESFSQMLDEFYDARERQELSARRGRELTHAVTVARDRMARKAENLKHDYAATQKRDEFRLRGDLITANLYRMKSGEKVLHAENYYEDGCPTIDIPLDPLLSPQQNAAKNYKQYNKLKTAEFHLREQIEKAENERAYLESVLQELSQAETEQEFNEIRRELQETNYLKKSSGGKKELKRAFAPRTFKTSSGLEVLVGRSNVQNDQLTKKADKRDYWFHTQHIHGSHVILRCAGLTPSDDDLREAAMLASYFSQAKESSSVPVDYCPVKFVKKPAGARPGMVTYDNYRTLYVTPEEGLAKKLLIR